MNDTDALSNGNGNGAKVDARFLALLARFYTVEMLQGWIARSEAGMRTKPGQLARWRQALAWLRQTQEQAGDET